CPPVLARLRIANHRTRAVIDLRFFSWTGEDDANGFRRLRAAEFTNEALDGVVSAAETLIGHHVLPDRSGITPATQSQRDRFPEWLAVTGGSTRFGKWNGRFL